MEHKPNFWATLPGILTGLAAVITAGTGLFVATRDGTQPTSGQPEPPPIVIPNGPTPSPQPDDHDHKEQPAPPTEPPPQPVPQPAPAPVAGGPATAKPEAMLTSLVDCDLAAYQLPNTVRSLMSWSDYYHGQIPTSGGTPANANHACQKALAYRGSAHCQQPGDTAVRQALFETLTLCRAAGVDETRISPQ